MNEVDLGERLLAELKELENLEAEAGALEAFLGERCAHEQSVIAETTRSIELLNDRIEDAKSAMRDRDPELSGQLDDVRILIDTRMREIKSLCRELDPSLLKVGSTFTGRGYRIRVSKTNVKEVYDSAELINRFPWVRDYEVDGVPLIREEANGDLMRIMVSRGIVQEDDIRDIRRQVVQRTPAVRITKLEEA